MTSLGPGARGVPEEERLPWLEEAPAAPPPRRGGGIVRLIALLLVVAAAAVLGLWWWHVRTGGEDAAGLIKAPPGPYKIRPPEAGGMAVEGEGYASFSASEGAEPTGALDLSAIPEAPLANPRGAPPKPGAAIEPRPEIAAPAAPAPAATAAGAGVIVQLGAFSSQAKATEAWKSLAARFAFLGAMEPVIAVATVDGGTVYRLRSVAPSPAAAAQICGRMRVAGETCLVVGA